MLPPQCQGVTVYLSLWHYVGLSVSIRLHPSVLTPVQQTIMVNQFFAHPVCQSVSLCFFVRFITASPSLSLYLCFSQPFNHPVYPFVQMELNILFCCDSTSRSGIVHLQKSISLSIPSSVLGLPGRMDCLLLNPSRPALWSGELFWASPFT